MSVRLEWITAADAHTWLVLPGEEAPDGQVADAPGDCVLVLGHGDSYGVAIQGDKLALTELLARAEQLVRREAP